MKSTKFIYSDNEVFIHSFDDNNVTEKLNPAIYQLKFNKDIGFFLTFNSGVFETPKSIYGSMERRVQKVVSTYEQRPSSTGVLLSGEKGSGKTMTASLICNQLIDKGLPVILINEQYQGSGFIEFLGNIGESVLFFDEFGKTFKNNGDNDNNKPTSYRSDNDTDIASQNALLSLFDGTYSCKRLILLTENDTRYINSFMLNRPGRIYYHFKYNKLDEDTLNEYCEKHDVPSDVLRQIKAIRNKSTPFSFDILVAIVAEWKRYGHNGETVEQLVADLNIPKGSDDISGMVIEEIIDTASNVQLYVPPLSRNYRYNIPESNDTESGIGYYITEDQFNHSDSDYNYENELTYYFNISDIVDRTLTHIVFLDRKTGHIFKLKIIYPSHHAYVPSAF